MNASQNDRKWKFPFIPVLTDVNQMFSFWGFWNFCFQFVSFGCFFFGECWYSVLYNSEADSQEEDYEALKDFKEIAAVYYPDFDTWDYPKGHFDETCMDAVPLSLYIITLSSSLEDAIRLAISHGDDGDTCEKVHQKIEND